MDVDAIVLSLSRHAGDSAAFAQAAAGITLAVVSNTVVKCGIVLTVGRGAIRGHVTRASAAVLVAGLLAAGIVVGAGRG